MALKMLQEKKDAALRFLGLEKGNNFIFVGNPGVGKSTILNGLVGGAKFKSGVSMNGAGITAEISKIEKDGIFYWDSPGLADVQMREEAAENIQKLFNMGGNYKIFFVVTVEAGRLRPADKLTIDQILNSIKGAASGQISYGVIFNKLTPMEYANFEDPNHEFRGFLTTLINTDVEEDAKIAKTLHTFALARSDELDTHHPMDNSMPITPKFREFLSKVPIVQLQKNKAARVDAKSVLLDVHNERFMQMEELMGVLHRDKEFMQQVVQQQREDMRNLIQENQRREEKFMALAQDVQRAQHELNIDPEARTKIAKKEPDAYGMIGDIISTVPALAEAAVPGVGALVNAGIKGLQGWFGL